MGHSIESPQTRSTMVVSSPPSWDGKCQNCRKLMSSCVCFRDSASDAEPLHTGSFHVITDASEARPLWNALRKMHRMSMAPCLPPPSSQNTSLEAKELQSKRSEALSPCSISTSEAPTSRRHFRPPSDARSPRREPRDEIGLEYSSLSRKSKMQRTVIPCSSHNFDRNVKDAGVVRSVRSTNSINNHSSIRVGGSKEKRTYGPEDDLRPSDEENKTVWEL